MTSAELRAWRTSLGISQAMLARLLKVDVMTVSRWERGVRSIPPFLDLALEHLEPAIVAANRVVAAAKRGRS